MIRSSFRRALNKILPCLLFLSPVLLTNCGLLNVQSDHQQNRGPQVRNVTWDARTNGDLRKKLIVLPFLDADVNDPQMVKNVARKTVVDDLVATGQFIVIDNSDIPQDISSFIKNNKYTMSEVAKVAAPMGISAVVEGNILNIHSKRVGDAIGLIRTLRARTSVTVRIRVYSTSTAKQMLDVTRTATVESDTTRVADNASDDAFLQNDPTLVRLAVRKAFNQTVGDIARAVEKLSWQGRIALISGDKIYLNAGRLSGIQIGDILRVTERGQEVFDPNTGVYIGTAPGRMKGTLEVVSYFGKDGAIAIVHSGSGFKQDDRVEMY